MNIIVGSDKEWSTQPYLSDLPSDFNIRFVKNLAELRDSLKEMATQGVDWIFLTHWSSFIPSTIFENHKTVVFHMTDLPFGRGGSPLQNLIIRGLTQTKITAIECTAVLDGGGILEQQPLNLQGSAHEIFLRSQPIMAGMIKRIIYESPAPRDQIGEVVRFPRRTPDQSEIVGSEDLEVLFDHIRMLDAPGYPKAFIKYGDFRLTFSEVKRESEGLVATVEIVSEGGAHR